MSEFLLEIGTEEIPAGYIPAVLSRMSEQMQAFMEKERISAGTPRVFGTPRRLTLWVPEVADQQEDVVELHTGPNVKVAYDKDGNPTKAALGFAKGKGLDISELTVESTPKGDVIAARVEKKGQPTQNVLADFLPDWIRALPFPKKMRWGASGFAFARPVHWVAGLLGGQPLSFQLDGIECGNTSLGHRFLNPEEFQFTDLDSYLATCKTHKVMVDPEERKKEIEAQVKKLADGVGGTVNNDPELLDTVTYLVEYPVALLGRFEEEYLELPVELLVITMKYHQKYFPVWQGDQLLPHFITISNMEAGEDSAIVNGNQRVLKARLEDARFFYQEDKKRTLESFLEDLKGVVLQKDLGTVYEKVERIEKLTGKLGGDKNSQRAARLCKADLTTQMVFEFPELQGIMGGYYAKESGESDVIATAIKEHYKPAFAGDEVPATLEGKMVALADKLDTIVGCIAVGLIPTGSEDPYALRRSAMGCIEILNHLHEENRDLGLNSVIEFAFQTLGDKKKLSDDEIRSHVEDLFRQRLKTLLSNEGYEYDVIDAVLATSIDSINDIQLRTAALSDLKKQDYFESLATAFKRVVKILEGKTFGDVDPELLNEAPEKALWEKLQEVQKPVADFMANRNYDAALKNIAGIKPQVDAFFDSVMVNAEDPALRDNRKALLFAISSLFADIADFSCIVVKKG